MDALAHYVCPQCLYLLHPEQGQNQHNSYRVCFQATSWGRSKAEVGIFIPQIRCSILFFLNHCLFLHWFKNFTLFAMRAQKGEREMLLQCCSTHPCFYLSRARHKLISKVMKRSYSNSSAVPGFFLVIRLTNCPAWRGKS